MKEINVVIYARESNHAGANESLARQKDELRTFCEKNGYVATDEVAIIGSRQESVYALKEAVELAKNTEDKILFMASTNRIVGTRDELIEVEELIKNAGVSIATMDGEYERVWEYGVSGSSLIAATLAAIEDE